jgi:hypothetical protein
MGVVLRESAKTFPEAIRLNELLLHSLSRVATINISSHTPAFFCTDFVSRNCMSKLFCHASMLSKEFLLSTSSSSSAEHSGSKRTHRRINIEYAGCLRYRCLRLISINEVLQDKGIYCDTLMSQVSNSQESSLNAMFSSTNMPLVEEMRSIISELSTTEKLHFLIELVRNYRLNFKVISCAHRFSSGCFKELNFSVAIESPYRFLHSHSANSSNSTLLIKLALRPCTTLSELVPNFIGSLLALDTTNSSSEEAHKNFKMLDVLITEITEVLGKSFRDCKTYCISNHLS